MNVMRYTVVDGHNAVSFNWCCEALKSLVAACAQNPRTLEELLSFASVFDPALRDYVLSGLAVFDEHNSRQNPKAIRTALEVCPPYQAPVFRVLDEVTKEASLTPVKAGVIVFNLRDKRIIQLHNTYAEIERAGRLWMRDEKAQPRRSVRYELPADWTLVP